MYTLITNDVEETSISKNRQSINTGRRVSKEALPQLLNIYSKYDICSTFYFTGTFAQRNPDAVDLVKANGHEIGCHSYSHKVQHSLDLLSVKEQYIHLTKAKKVLEDIAGTVKSFRAPALRLGDSTIKILEKLGFNTDSSVCPQRFDGPFTFGSARKLRWLYAPREVYHPNYSNPYIQGSSKLLEIPISAFLLGYQGTTMRIVPRINDLVGEISYRESRKTGRPIVFLFHPNELIKESTSIRYTRRSKSRLGSFFGDVIRRKLKLSNLGKNAGKLLEDVLRKGKAEGAEFLSVSQFSKKYKNNNNI